EFLLVVDRVAGRGRQRGVDREADPHKSQSQKQQQDIACAEDRPALRVAHRTLPLHMDTSGMVRGCGVILLFVDAGAAFQALIIWLGLGLLVGLQRERTKPRLGGIRTYGLITVLGTVSALLGLSLGGWVVAAALLAVVGAVVSANLIAARD